MKRFAWEVIGAFLFLVLVISPRLFARWPQQKKNEFTWVMTMDIPESAFGYSFSSPAKGSDLHFWDEKHSVLGGNLDSAPLSKPTMLKL